MAAEENVRPGVLGRCKKHFPDRPGGQSRTFMAQGEGQGACRGCEEQGIGSTGEGIMVCDSCPTSTWTKRNKEENGSMEFKDYYWPIETYCSVMERVGFREVTSYVPEVNPRTFEEIEFLQSKDFFPDVDYQALVDEKPTVIIVGKK